MGVALRAECIHHHWIETLRQIGCKRIENVGPLRQRPRRDLIILNEVLKPGLLEERFVVRKDILPSKIRHHVDSPIYCAYIPEIIVDIVSYRDADNIIERNNAPGMDIG